MTITQTPHPILGNFSTVQNPFGMQKNADFADKKEKICVFLRSSASRF